MANFVTNIVHFDGDPERILDLRGAVQDDQYGMSGIDFRKITPMPSGLWMGGINPDTRFRFGKNHWLDWSVANWGTKWNAFRFDDDDQYSDSQITFVTAKGKVIGSLGIEEYSEENYPELDALQGREIGYVLSKSYWGQGLMPEAIKAVINWLFNEEKLDFIIVGHFDRNAQSRRVIEKCGFQYIKNTKFETRYDTVENSVEYNKSTRR